MSTPSETMLTATIQGSRERVNATSFSRRPRLGVQHDQRRPAGALAQQRGDPARVRGVGRDHQAAGVAVAVRRAPPQLGVGLAQDPRQAVGQLGRDRRPVAAAGLARAQHGLEARLDHVVAAAPRQRPVVGDEADRPADPVARPPRRRCRSGRARRARPRRSRTPGIAAASERNGVPDSSSHRGTPPNAVANPSPHASSSPRWWASSATTSDDDRQRSGPPPRRLGDPGVGDRDAVKALRRPRRVAVRRELDPERARGARPLTGQRRRRARDDHGLDRAGGELGAGKLERRARLARSRRGRQQKCALRPVGHSLQRLGLPGAQGACVMLVSRSQASAASWRMGRTG